MGLLLWLTRNWADTDAAESQLAPLELPLPPAEALLRVEAVIPKIALWKIVTAVPETGTIAATRTTRLWRFVDDITLRVEATPTGSRLHARSQSRVGKGDLGQNRRNLGELFAALETPS
jgi:uncharacterized protein (DUF1499 family)